MSRPVDNPASIEADRADTSVDSASLCAKSQKVVDPNSRQADCEPWGAPPALSSEGKGREPDNPNIRAFPKPKEVEPFPSSSSNSPRRPIVWHTARRMGDKAPQSTAIGTDDDPTRGLPYHNKIKADLDDLLRRKREVDRNVAMLEESVYKKETEYWENTPFGNILTGFDNYVKGSTGTASGGRRKGILTDADRVFSRSSVRLTDAVDSPGPLSATSTPSHAPTPVNSSHLKGEASNAPTPTSSTSANKTGAGQKKTKRAAEDSETDTKESKKVRTNFGVTRK